LMTIVRLKRNRRLASTKKRVVTSTGESFEAWPEFARA
jgi:hypothetical protein